MFPGAGAGAGAGSTASATYTRPGSVPSTGSNGGELFQVARFLDVALEPSVHALYTALCHGDAYLSYVHSHLPAANAIVDMQLARAEASAGFMHLRNHPRVKVAVVNTQTFSNFVAHRLYTSPTRPVDVVWLWYWNGPTGRVRVSLRSVGNRFNCGAYAANFEGGGNEHTASFTCDPASMWSHFAENAQ
jgi:hypothetical protein